MVSPAGGSGASAAGSLSNNTESAKKSPFSSLRPQSYDLYMSNDCYTQGHTQWFYYSVKNVVVGQSVNFNIRNFSKPDSLFTEGEIENLLYFSCYYYCYSFSTSLSLIN